MGDQVMPTSVEPRPASHHIQPPLRFLEQILVKEGLFFKYSIAKPNE